MLARFTFLVALVLIPSMAFSAERSDVRLVLDNLVCRNQRRNCGKQEASAYSYERTFVIEGRGSYFLFYRPAYPPEWPLSVLQVTEDGGRFPGAISYADVGTDGKVNFGGNGWRLFCDSLGDASGICGVPENENDTEWYPHWQRSYDAVIDAISNACRACLN